MLTWDFYFLGQFLLGQIALDNEVMQQSEGETACSLKCKETVSDDEDEEFQFSNLMDRLGAKKILDEWVFTAIVIDSMIFYNSALSLILMEFKINDENQGCSVTQWFLKN